MRNDAPSSGLLRSVYFLAAAAVTVFVVITGVFAFYDPPEGGDAAFPGGFDFQQQDGPFDGASGGQVLADFGNERDDYNRNVSLIFAAVSAAVFAAAILGLGARWDPLRAALVAGGLVLFLISMGYWSGGSDQWTGFVMTCGVLAVVAGSYPWLEDGLPLSHRKPAREIEVPRAGQPGPPPPPPPPPFTPPRPPMGPA